MENNKIIFSFALFKSPSSRKNILQFSNYFPFLLRAFVTIFPNAEFRLHHNKTINKFKYSPVLYELNRIGLIKLVLVDRDDPVTKGMLWRLMPLLNKEDIDYVFCRDVDYLPSPREHEMIKVFLSHKAGLHCINDNKVHTVPIMGGMCGFHKGKFRRLTGYNNFRKMINSISFSSQKWSKYGSDQQFLQKKIWPKMKHEAIVHRCGWKKKDKNLKACYFKVGKSVPKGTSREILENGDSFINFIGHGSGRATKGIPFYEQYGNKELIELIKKAEKEFYKK